MPFVLKRIETEDSESTPPRVFAGTIKIGSGRDCDLIIDSKQVLPFHCELYHRATEYRFVATPSAFVEINDADVLKWPAVLQDEDILTIGDTRFRFHILQQTAKRSWKASFASYLAVILLIALIIFEIIIMIWLPYKLQHQKNATLATTIQGIYRTMDELRPKTHALPAGKDDTNSGSMKAMLIACEDNIASYLRRYGNKMDWDQARIINRDIYHIKNIIDSWDAYKDVYAKTLSLNPEKYIDNLTNQIEEKAVKQQKINKKSLNVNF